MLVTEILGKVTFLKFIPGSRAGVVLTIPMQLWLGCMLGHDHPAAAVKNVGRISCVTLGVALLSWMTFVLVSKLK